MCEAAASITVARICSLRQEHGPTEALLGTIDQSEPRGCLTDESTGWLTAPIITVTANAMKKKEKTIRYWRFVSLCSRICTPLHKQQ